jgi:hypothetical protein
VIQGRHPGFPATHGLRKGDDAKPNALRVGECELGLSVIFEAIFLVGARFRQPVQSQSPSEFSSAVAGRGFFAGSTSADVVKAVATVAFQFTEKC